MNAFHSIKDQYISHDIISVIFIDIAGIIKLWTSSKIKKNYYWDLRELLFGLKFCRTSTKQYFPNDLI